MSRRRALELGALLTACATALLATLPRLTDRPVWTDEALTVGATSQLVDAVRETGGTMALYYALVTPVTWWSTDRFWLRLPSALLVVAVVAVTFFVGRRLGGRWLGASAALALSCTWALARWGIEARGYALAMLLVALSWWGLVEAGLADDARRRRRWWALAAVAIVLAPLAHGLAALAFPFQAAVLLVRDDRRAWARRLAPVAVAWGLLGVVLLGLGAGEVASWIEPLGWSDLKQVHAMLIGRGWLGVAVGLVVLAGTVLAAMAVRAAPPWQRAQGAGWRSLVVLAWAWGVPLAILAVSLVRPYQEPRYMVTSLPGIALLTATAIVRVRPVALRAAALAVVCAALLSMQSAVTASSGEDWPSIVGEIEREGRPGDELVMRPLLRAPFDYAAMEAGAELVVTPTAPSDPLGPPRRIYQGDEEPLRELVLASDAATVWVVVRGDEAKDEAEALRDDPAIAAERQVAVVEKSRGQLAVYRLRLRAEG